jgi:hypothetical protein
MNSSDRNAQRDLGALYAALAVKSFASGLTPAARERAIFAAEFTTSERAEGVDERIDALRGNYRTRDFPDRAGSRQSAASKSWCRNFEAGSRMYYPTPAQEI